MTTPVRIGTFNVENLFSRAKVINFQNDEPGKDLLTKIGHLDALLDAEVYDKDLIIELYDELKPYISIEEEIGKLFKTVNGKTTIVATGKADFVGRIEFKRDNFTDIARKNTARVIRTVNADVCCLVEVESRPVLKNFRTDLLKSTSKFKRPPYAMCIDGNDDRGIDVAILSRIPIRTLRSHVDDKIGNSEIFSRDCLEVELVHPDGFTIWVLLNHLKSKGFGTQESSNTRRKNQAKRIAEILEGFDLAKDLVVVAGDLNDTPDSDPLSPLLQVPNLFDVLAEKFPDKADRWTYHFKKNEQIDYLLASKPLRDALQAAGVERRGIFNVEKFTGGAIKQFDTVTRLSESASDHGAVFADFLIG